MKRLIALLIIAAAISLLFDNCSSERTMCNYTHTHFGGYK